MQLFRNAVSVKNRQQIAFKCRACGACCKNVRDSIVLEPLDAYRIVRDKQKNGCVFILPKVLLRDDRCTISSVRPHTCRLYPFTAEPCPEEHRIKWYLCTEQSHHFGTGSVTAREWQRKNMSDEDEAFWFDECRILPELGKLLRSVPKNNFQRAEQLIVAYRYLAYDFDQPFLSQYRDNMLFLKAMLEKLA